MDVTIIAALAAGSFAATKELARRIGEVEFNALYHQGNGSHIFMNSVDDDTIMITVFGKRTTVGLVRFYSAATAQARRGIAEVDQERGRGRFPLRSLRRDARRSSPIVRQTRAVAQRADAEKFAAHDMAVQFRDYYETLGVAKTADAAEIKSAFRKLARIHHPDVAKPKDKAAAEEKFKQINEAYEVLSDPEKRAKYDQLGANWNQPGGFPPPPGGGGAGGGFRRSGGGNGEGVEFEFGGTGFSDFFEQFFGGGRGESAFGGGRFRPAADDGGTRPGCRGRHHGHAGRSAQRFEAARFPCGAAVPSKVETYQVKIPRGVHEGQRIRLAGQGEAGAGGGKSGDLFLRVRLARHPDFSVEGNDLVHEATLDAVAGSARRPSSRCRRSKARAG